ncbi:MAG: hypothetical protein ACYCR4_12885 [Acidimicrobiales bacterium]
MALVQREDGDGVPLAEMRAYVLANPHSTVMSLVRRFGLSQRRVAACLADLEATGQLVRDSVLRTDGYLYSMRKRSDRGLLLVHQGIQRKRAFVAARAKALEVEELGLVLPFDARALAEKRVVAGRASAVVTGRMVVSARWLLGLLDATAGRVSAPRRRRVLRLPGAARADESDVELLFDGSDVIDVRVAVDAAWLAELVGRSRRQNRPPDASELVARLSESAGATVAVRDLSSIASGAPARIEVDAAWLAGVVAACPSPAVPGL